MTAFSERFAARGAPRLLAAFGEEVVYKPIGGAPRTITANVRRNPPEEIADGVKVKDLTIDVYNDRTTGVEARSVKTGQDTIEVADIVGGDVRDKSILAILDDTCGMVTLLVR